MTYVVLITSENIYNTLPKATLATESQRDMEMEKKKQNNDDDYMVCVCECGHRGGFLNN